MLIKNCKIIFDDRIEEGSLQIINEKIYSVNSNFIEDKDIIDAKGLYLSAGFIDIHLHGAGGHDTMEGTYESLNSISKTIAAHGTTSFIPTTMTCDIKDIQQALSAIAEAKFKGTDGAKILGAHLEGPFINPLMIGAQNPKFVKKPNMDVFNSIVGNHIAEVLKITLAPEMEGASELIKHLVDQNIIVSIGHSNASYDSAIKAIQLGISHSTHLFNAMSAFHHREPGVTGAIFDSHITTEVICDGIHVAYPSLRVAFRQKSIDKIILITDAMMACCMEDGVYSLGGQSVHVINGCARLENGVLSGSILTLDRAVKNLRDNTNLELYEIIKMATYNAAKHLKLQKRKGLIKSGYDADIILFDEKIDIKIAIVGGKIVYSQDAV